MYIFWFLSDPSSVNLEKVSDILVDQSLKDQVFSKEAGRICFTIVQVHTVYSLLSSFVSLIKTLSTSETEGFKEPEQA